MNKEEIEQDNIRKEFQKEISEIIKKYNKLLSGDEIRNIWTGRIVPLTHGRKNIFGLENNLPF